MARTGSYLATLPLGRMVKPTEVAETAYLAEEGNSAFRARRSPPIPAPTATATTAAPMAGRRDQPAGRRSGRRAKAVVELTHHLGGPLGVAVAQGRVVILIDVTGGVLGVEVAKRAEEERALFLERRQAVRVDRRRPDGSVPIGIPCGERRGHDFPILVVGFGDRSDLPPAAEGDHQTGRGADHRHAGRAHTRTLTPSAGGTRRMSVGNADWISARIWSSLRRPSLTRAVISLRRLIDARFRDS